MAPLVDKVMMPYLTRVCYAAAFFAGMVQAAYQFAKLGGTSGHTGNIVSFGQAFSQILHTNVEDKHHHCVEAFQRFLILFQYVAGNFAGGVWTAHDERKSLRTAGRGLICTGILLCLAAFLTALPHGLDELGGTGGHIQQLGSFAMGLQNGVLVSITGYVNTVTTTGTITDVGLLVGGLTAKRCDAEWFWKFFTLSSLVISFIGGSVVGGMVFYKVKSRFDYVFGAVAALSLPGVCLMFLGCIALRHSHRVLSRLQEPMLDPIGDTANARPDVAVIPRRKVSASDEAARLRTVSEDSASSQISRKSRLHLEDTPSAPPPPPPPPPALCVRKMPLVFASFCASFLAGMMDVASQRTLPNNPLPTHVTGPSSKLGMGVSALLMGGSDAEKDLFLTNFLLCSSFFVGSCLAGVVANTDARRSRHVGSLSLMAVGCVLIMGSVLGYLSSHRMEGAYFSHDFAGELQHLCGLGMGFQNGILCAITGFARTTHMTGPMANFGICLGQVSNPGKVTPQILFKLNANLVLVLFFTLGIVVEDVLQNTVSRGNARWVSVPALGLIVLAVVELIVESKRNRARLISGSTPLTSEEGEMNNLRDLACAGGFTDSIVNIRTTSTAGVVPSRSRFRNLQLPVSPIISFIEEESDDEPFLAPATMHQAPFHHSIIPPRRPVVAAPTPTANLKRTQSAPGISSLQPNIPRPATLSFTRMPSLTEIEFEMAFECNRQSSA